MKYYWCRSSDKALQILKRRSYAFPARRFISFCNENYKYGQKLTSSIVQFLGLKLNYFNRHYLVFEKIG